REDEPLGTAGGVLAAQDRLRRGDEPILIVSGDGLHDVDLATAERVHRESGALATLVMVPVADPSEYGVAVTDADWRITEFQEKPALGTEKSSLANTGIYILKPEVLDLCTSWNFTDFGSELFPRMVEEQLDVRAHVPEACWWNDIGDLDEWRAANNAVIRGDVNLGAGPWNDDAAAGDLLIHPSANVSPDAELVGPCVVGAGAVV